MTCLRLTPVVQKWMGTCPDMSWHVEQWKLSLPWYYVTWHFMTCPRLTGNYKSECCLYSCIRVSCGKQQILILSWVHVRTCPDKSVHVRTCGLVQGAEAMTVRFIVEQVLDQIFFKCPARLLWFWRGIGGCVRRWRCGRIQPIARCIIFRRRGWRRNPSSWKRDFPVKNLQNQMVLSSISQPGRMAEHKGPEMTPGPTTHAVSHAHDMASSFYLFITPAIEKSSWTWQIWRVFKNMETAGKGWMRLICLPT